MGGRERGREREGERGRGETFRVMDAHPYMCIRAGVCVCVCVCVFVRETKTS